MRNNLILNIPHASVVLKNEDVPRPQYEPHCWAYWSGGGQGIVRRDRLNAYREELPFMTDWYTDELFINGIGTALTAPVSRLICDMERFRDRDKEPMEKNGMGICYTKRHDGTELVDYSFLHRNKIIEKYYDPYHRRLTELADEALQEFPYVMILDCHSFSPVPLPYEPDQSPDRPDICIGTDAFHTPADLVETASGFFRSKGYSVKIDSPYAGTIVPMKHYGKNRRVRSVMIELNRGLYLKDGTCEKNDYFPVLKEHLREFQELLEIQYAAST